MSLCETCLPLGKCQYLVRRDQIEQGFEQAVQAPEVDDNMIIHFEEVREDQLAEAGEGAVMLNCPFLK